MLFVRLIVCYYIGQMKNERVCRAHRAVNVVVPWKSRIVYNVVLHTVCAVAVDAGSTRRINLFQKLSQ